MKAQISFDTTLWIVPTLCVLVGANPVGSTTIRGRSHPWTVGQLVHTSSGHVAGQAAPQAEEVSQYLGIPYAQPPVGSLRFQPPVKFNGSSTINATAFGPACISPPPRNHSAQPNALLGIPASADPILASLDDVGAYSEDCLTLNVWTKPQVGEKKKAVLVWTHGGGYVTGSSRTSIYNGKFIANETDVVVVSLNYRLNIFGFPGNPIGTKNLGLHDLRMALEWIRDNIDKFGGDADRITMFAQSAGASMTDFYSFAYASDPIARGFILMSATVDGFPPVTTATANQKWFNMTQQIDCGDSSVDPVEVSNCMMNKTTAEIQTGFAPTDAGLGDSVFGPTVDNVVIFENYENRTSAKGGYLIGNTHNEAGLFRIFNPNQPDSYWAAFNNVSYTCADAIRIAQTTRDSYPTWRYRYFGDFPNMVVTTTPPSGAYHTSDIQPLFNTVPQNYITSTPQEVAIGDYIRGAWAALAKDPTEGLLSYGGGWPKYQATEKTLIRTGFQNQTGPSLAYGNEYDSSCSPLPQREQVVKFREWIKEGQAI